MSGKGRPNGEKVTDLGVGMLAALPRPWCDTCGCVHVANMPAHTWRCRQCGFGSQSPAVAAEHALLYPQDEVYPVFHAMRVAPIETTTEHGPIEEGQA